MEFIDQEGEKRGGRLALMIMNRNVGIFVRPLSESTGRGESRSTEVRLR